MELCISSSTKLLNKNPCRPPHALICSTSASSLRNPVLQFKHRPIGSLKLLSPSRLIHHLQPLPFPRNPCQFAVSASSSSSSSSSVALGNEKDRLPADIEVKETEEPNSRVSLSLLNCLRYFYCYYFFILISLL
jgi:trigger factor